MTRRESPARRASEGVDGKTTMQGQSCAIDDRSEWIEPDGLGGYASGTATGINTRRYHALLLASARPPVDRYVLVNTLEAWIECGTSVYPLTSQRYAPGITHPLGTTPIRGFSIDPWPTWDIQPAPGVRIRHERLVRHGEPTTLLTWSLIDSDCSAQLVVRLLMSGRDYHSLHHANAAFRFDSDIWGGRIQWEPYAGIPPIVAITNGDYEHRPDWYRGFQYEEERSRGQDCVEDLASPGVLRWDLSQGPAVLALSAKVDDEPHEWTPKAAVLLADRIKQAERTRRAAFDGSLHRAADAYIVVRQPSPEVPAGKTIIAGYPWFTDWGRDTFISLRGLCLARGAERLDDARDILLTWAALVSEGMQPNRLPDRGTEPEYNAADASLWFVLAAGAYLGVSREPKHAGAESRKTIIRAISEIVEGYSKGTRYGIGLDQDGLIRAGVAGVQLTWMDAKVGDWVVTPRIGKPVELQALWLNALRVYAEVSGAEHPAFASGMESFAERYWDEQRGWLCDVVDVDHKPGALDESLRPNQLYAVGGLPLALVDESICARVVERVERALMTPKGPRSLAPDDPGYRGRYEGDLWARDGAYHMGTVWPYLIGPFVDAWVRSRGGTPESKREARERFLDPLLASMACDGLGHISEIADGDPPHTGRGCPFQAWSVAEALRLDRDVLCIEEAAIGKRAKDERKVPERRIVPERR
ncbi:MAG: glycogen debranching enzyme family protein [Phycisphaeraceae bacterium]|nr:glycogen debranching enzyme family protein [Phycisphaeraceae bacterium]MBX3367867.1 glycogen debranching enzyme family protein [Phycisphaeraceae bacterium]